MSLNESGFERETKKTRKREFLDEMERAASWVTLLHHAFLPDRAR